MYHNGIAMPNMSKLPTPRGSTTPVTMAIAFCLIEKMPSTSTEVQTMQALNVLQKSLSTSGSIIRRPTPMKIVDQPVNKSESSAEQTQNQPVTPVSFASSTQVRMDTAVPSPVGQRVPQVPPVQVPLSQITSVASMENIAVSMASQQSGASATTQPQQQTEQCRKCGKKNHPTSHSHQKVTYRKCKGKDHITKFCPMPNQATMQQPRINFGMILSTKFGLEQFLEMTKALKCIEDKYSKPQYNRCEPSKEENSLNKENQQPNSSTQLTSQTNQHGKITQNMQIGNISVEQMATLMGSDPENLVEALEEVFGSQSTEEQDTQEEETA